jgi:nicotinamidase-related amidase
VKIRPNQSIATIVLCGISTNLGVESTARFAYEYGYQQIFVEDAVASGNSKEEHEATINYIFRRMGRVRKTEDILSELK